MDITDRLYQKLEKMDLPPTESHNVKVLIKQAIAAGLACNIPTNPLEGYSNLTAAISAGEPIDWERLDGLRVRCVHPEVGTLHGTLERNESRTADYHAGWWHKGADSLYRSAFIYGWNGYDGWTLWVEGEVPLRRKTADQLAVGTYFLDVEGGALMYVGAGHQRGLKAVYRSPEMFVSPVPAEKWEVIEEYGTFQKPERK